MGAEFEPSMRIVRYAESARFARLSSVGDNDRCI